MYTICSKCGAINKTTNITCVKCEMALGSDVFSPELEANNEEFYNAYIPGEYEAYKEEINPQSLHIKTRAENNPVALMSESSASEFSANNSQSLYSVHVQPAFPPNIVSPTNSNIAVSKKRILKIIAVIAVISLFLIIGNKIATFNSYISDDEYLSDAENSSNSGSLFVVDTYTLVNVSGGVSIVEYSVPAGFNGNLVIPQKLDGKEVISIGGSAFMDCTSLVSVTIPKGVVSIDYGAFKYCTNLKSITIPDSVTSIGENAFEECESLESITIPDSVTEINDETFIYCSNLKNVNLPQGITIIGNDAFTCCYNISSITIPNSVTEIGESAFELCDSMTSITISNNVTSIGSCAFQFTGLTNVTIPESVTSIGSDVFGYCDNITIHGVKGSYAETYAQENNIPFRVLL